MSASVSMRSEDFNIVYAAYNKLELTFAQESEDIIARFNKLSTQGERQRGLAGGARAEMIVEAARTQAEELENIKKMLEQLKLFIESKKESAAKLAEKDTSFNAKAVASRAASARSNLKR